MIQKSQQKTTLQETNIALSGGRAPKGNSSEPTIDFQGLCVSFMECTLQETITYPTKREKETTSFEKCPAWE